MNIYDRGMGGTADEEPIGAPGGLHEMQTRDDRDAELDPGWEPCSGFEELMACLLTALGSLIFVGLVLAGALGGWDWLVAWVKGVLQ